jgi:YHS domain-containing protein
VLLAAIGIAILLAWTAWAVAANHGGHADQASPAGKSAAGACETCGKPIVTKTMVTLTRAADHSQHHYACIHCALLAARDYVGGDVKVTAHSAVQGTKLEWTRTGGVWQVAPASAVVLSVPEVNGTCDQSHLAFKDQAEFDSYAKAHHAVHAKPIAGAKVDAILLAGRGPAPEEATCPVMGNKVHPDAKTEWTVYQGKVYYFCCPGCKPKFTSDPAGFASGKTKIQGKGAGCGGHSGSGGGGCGGGSSAGRARGPGSAAKPPTAKHTRVQST